MKKDKLLLCLINYASCLHEKWRKSFHPVYSPYFSLKINRAMVFGAVPTQAIPGLGKQLQSRVSLNRHMREVIMARSKRSRREATAHVHLDHSLLPGRSHLLPGRNVSLEAIWAPKHAEKCPVGFFRCTSMPAWHSCLEVARKLRRGVVRTLVSVWPGWHLSDALVWTYWGVKGSSWPTRQQVQSEAHSHQHRLRSLIMNFFLREGKKCVPQYYSLS